jgi:hypothetical protein
MALPSKSVLSVRVPPAERDLLGRWRNTPTLT